MEDDERTASRMGSIKLGEALRPNGAEYSKVSTEASPTDSKVASPQPGLSPPEDAKPSNESGSTPDTERPAKPSRKPSQKAKREPVLFDLLPDVTEAACECFQLIPDCLYGSKHMGSTDSDALDCDCKEDWRTSLCH
jgi:histone-lysine N-methyltransferase SETD2